MPDRAKAFADCGRIVLRVYNENNPGSKQFTDAAATARKITLAMAKEMLEGCLKGVEAPITKHVRNVLKDLHPENRYAIVDKILSDLLDISTTFKSIEEGVERKSREKLLDARFFCEHMSHELRRLRK